MYDMHNTFMVWTSNGEYNKISQAILDLGLWELTLPPQPGYPVISRDISWDILDLGPRDLTLPPQLGDPGMLQDIPWDILDLGLWNLTVFP